MAWNDTAPDGTQSVKANEAILQANTTYTETTMQIDHYWDESANTDGHHRKVGLIDIASSGVALDGNGSPTTLQGDEKGEVFTRQKTATECSTEQNFEPFTYYVDSNAVKQYLQLGFRALANFDGRSTNGACTINYSHNVSGVSRTGAGLYTVSFSNDMPTNFYICSGMAMRAGSSSALNVGVQSHNTYGTKVLRGSVLIAITSTAGGALTEPLNVMLMVSGG